MSGKMKLPWAHAPADLLLPDNYSNFTRLCDMTDFLSLTLLKTIESRIQIQHGWFPGISYNQVTSTVWIVELFNKIIVKSYMGFFLWCKTLIKEFYHCVQISIYTLTYIILPHWVHLKITIFTEIPTEYICSVGGPLLANIYHLCLNIRKE